MVKRSVRAHNPAYRVALPRHMTTAKKGKEAGDSAKTSRCWPGFEPVPGKAEHEQGSCKKVPASKNGGKPVDRETARKKQISLGGKRAEQAKAKSPNAAERRSVSKGAKASAAAKKVPAKKASAKKGPAKKAAAKNAPAKKAAAKKAPAKKAAEKKVAA